MIARTAFAASVIALLTFGVDAWRAAEHVVPLPKGEPSPVPLQWRMFGGDPSRNMVSLAARNLPTVWSDEDGKTKNIKWIAKLGSKAYGGPAIAGGRIFVGTNNQDPRDKKLSDKDGHPIDLGVLMCFNETDGKFLWQAIHRKLPIGHVQDWPLEGIASTPAIEGDRFYYVSNRGELVCADVKTGKAIWTLDPGILFHRFPKPD